MFSLYQPPNWCRHTHCSYFYTQESTSQEWRSSSQRADWPTRYPRHLYFHALCCVSTPCTAMGRVNVFVERWPNHRFAGLVRDPAHCVCCCTNMEERGHTSAKDYQATQYCCRRIYPALYGCHDDDNDLLHPHLVSSHQGKLGVPCHEI